MFMLYDYVYAVYAVYCISINMSVQDAIPAFHHQEHVWTCSDGERQVIAIINSRKESQKDQQAISF